MVKILISEKIDSVCQSIFEEAGFQVDVKPGLTAEELLTVIGGYEGLVVRSATKVTAEVLEKGVKLKVVGRAGAGVDTIDVAAASSRKVLVMNTPGQNANAVAELVMGMMFALVRHVVTGCVGLREGRWEKKNLSGTELLNKSIGIIGYGAIGRRLGSMAQGIGMTVLATDPFLNENQIRAGGAKLSTFDEIISSCDFISLHLPKTPETTGMINKDVLAKMKPSAVLINCARGGLVDENALAEALKGGKLAGAAMDVFEQEPPAAGNPLLSLPNFIGTPHIGASTEEAQVNVAVAIAKQMVAYFKEGATTGAVNA